MQLSRTNTEVNLYSPFLLKFEGRMTQISKKGTLTTPPPVFAASFQRQVKKSSSAVLTQKRADNILLGLNEIRNRNAMALQHMTNRHEDSPPKKQPEDCLATVVEHLSPSSLSLSHNVLIDGAFSNDFRRMLRQLDNISPRKNK